MKPLLIKLQHFFIGKLDSSDVAEDLGIHPILLFRWRKEYRKGKFKENKRKKKGLSYG